MNVTCPTCKNRKQLVERGSAFFPFCSKACRERDLSAWAGEEYRIPGRVLSEDEIDQFSDSEQFSDSDPSS